MRYTLAIPFAQWLSTKDDKFLSITGIEYNQTDKVCKNQYAPPQTEIHLGYFIPFTGHSASNIKGNTGTSGAFMGAQIQIPNKISNNNNMLIC
jgi:hypothetical protein